jgi:hypothetical protein
MEQPGGVNGVDGVRFFYRMGASQLLRTICATTGGDALFDLRSQGGHQAERFRHSKYIIA